MARTSWTISYFNNFQSSSVKRARTGFLLVLPTPGRTALSTRFYSIPLVICHISGGFESNRSVLAHKFTLLWISQSTIKGFNKWIFSKWTFGYVCVSPCRGQPISPKVHQSEGSQILRFSNPKVHQSEGPLGPKNTEQCVQCSKVQCIAMQCCAVLHSALQRSTLQHCTVQHNVGEYCVKQHSPSQHSVTHFCAIQWTLIDSRTAR